MGNYVVTGGSKGIGREVVRILREGGHSVLNVDYDKGDLCVDLGTREGRAAVIETAHRMFPDGIDGLASNAGIASSEPLSRTIRINYFGAVVVMEGLYDLLKMKKGHCVTTVSGSVCYSARNNYSVDRLLVDNGDEERICKLVDTFDPRKVDNAIYVSTKIGLIRWMRRTAPAWAMEDVKLNALAPGGVNTTIMNGVMDMAPDPDVARSLVCPMLEREQRLMYPEEFALSIVHLLLPTSCGSVGSVLYCDAGQENILHTEKWY